MTGLSYSHYAALRKCGQYYKLSVLEKRPQPKSAALEFGSALHAGLHDSLVSQNAESAMDVFEAYWKSVVSGISFDGERHGPEDLQSMGCKFISNFHKRYACKMRIVVGEKRMYQQDIPLLVTDGSSPLRLEGTPDALVEYEGQNILLDFKTSAYAYLPEKIPSSLQLNLYATLLEQNGHRVDGVAYVVFVKGTGSIQTPQIAPYSREKSLAMIAEMVHYFKRNEGHYEKNPANCTMGKFVCAYFKDCWL